MVYYLTNTLPESVPMDQQKNVSPAAKNKAAYIESCMEREKIVHKHIYLGSPSKFGFYKNTVKKVSEYTQERCLQRIGGNFNNGVLGKCLKKFAYLNAKRIVKNFLKTLTEQDTLIAYHTLLFADVIAAAKKRHNFKLILELEEIYQNVCVVNADEQLKEQEVIRVADAYLLSTDCLVKCIEQGKPYLTINGTYQSEKDCKISDFTDSKIHCVYAGTFEAAKGGAKAAIQAAAFLPKNYMVHILGFGSQEQIHQVQQLIHEIQQITECTICYEGLMSGADYIQFLQKCQIGLCTQIPDKQYANTSFPSKVLTYMANGLHVVSSKFDAIEQSHIGHLVHYYEEQTPEMMAKAIMDIDLQQPYNPQNYLKTLDKDCRVKLKNLISSL